MVVGTLSCGVIGFIKYRSQLFRSRTAPWQICAAICLFVAGWTSGDRAAPLGGGGWSGAAADGPAGVFTGAGHWRREGQQHDVLSHAGEVWSAGMRVGWMIGWLVGELPG